MRVPTVFRRAGGTLALSLGTVTLLTAACGNEMNGQATRASESATTSTYAPRVSAARLRPSVTATARALVPTTAASTTTTVVAPPTSATNPNLAVLFPAETLPVSGECNVPITFAVDGTFGPLLCANGAVNVVAWAYYWNRYQPELMTLGREATQAQVENAICSTNLSNPMTTDVETLVAAYNGWSFHIDPQTILDGCRG